MLRELNSLGSGVFIWLDDAETLDRGNSLLYATQRLAEDSSLYFTEE